MPPQPSVAMQEILTTQGAALSASCYDLCDWEKTYILCSHQMAEASSAMKCGHPLIYIRVLIPPGMVALCPLYCYASPPPFPQLSLSLQVKATARGYRPWRKLNERSGPVVLNKTPLSQS